MDISSGNAADRFCNSPLWQQGKWIATTFRCHPTNDAPPVMGLVFDDWQKAGELFRSWIDDWGNADEDELIRVAIIEGDLPEQAPGYNVRISSNDLSSEPYTQDSDSQNESSSIDDKRLGQVMRMHPVAGLFEQLGAEVVAELKKAGGPEAEAVLGDMLTPFKEAYLKHGEYLLAPVILKEDGQLWFDIQYGIIKRGLVLRHADDISEADPDYPAW